MPKRDVGAGEAVAVSLAGFPLLLRHPSHLADQLPWSQSRNKAISEVRGILGEDFVVKNKFPRVTASYLGLLS